MAINGNRLIVDLKKVIAADINVKPKLIMLRSEGRLLIDCDEVIDSRDEPIIVLKIWEENKDTGMRI